MNLKTAVRKIVAEHGRAFNLHRDAQLSIPANMTPDRYARAMWFLLGNIEANSELATNNTYKILTNGSNGLHQTAVDALELAEAVLRRADK